LEERNLHKPTKKKIAAPPCHGGEELELAGDWYGEWLRWQEEGGTVLIWMLAISPDWCYEPRLKDTP
jgi:hypothetical protein